MAHTKRTACILYPHLMASEDLPTEDDCEVGPLELIHEKEDKEERR